jgi:hypothetical protein
MKDFYVFNWQETTCFTIENVQQKIICVIVGTLALLKMPYNCVDTSTLLKKIGKFERDRVRNHTTKYGFLIYTV